MTPFPTSLCHACRHVRLNRTSRGSVFIQCQHPELPKYRSQPVTRCEFHANAVLQANGHGPATR